MTHEGVSSEEAKSLSGALFSLVLYSPRCAEARFGAYTSNALEPFTNVGMRSVALRGFLIFCFLDGERADLQGIFLQRQKTNQSPLT